MNNNSTISPRFNIDIEKFKDWTDDKFLDLVKEPGHTYTNDEEEALVYFLLEKYDPLLQRIYKYMFNESELYTECLTELYIRMRNNDWHALRMFKRNIPFPRWYALVTRNIWHRFKASIQNTNICID